MLCLLGVYSLVREFVREVHPVVFVFADIRTLLRRLLRRRLSTDWATDEVAEGVSDGLRPRIEFGFAYEAPAASMSPKASALPWMSFGFVYEAPAARRSANASASSILSRDFTREWVVGSAVGDGSIGETEVSFARALGAPVVLEARLM